MRNPLRLGLCSQVWGEDATAPGEAEGLTGNRRGAQEAAKEIQVGKWLVRW